MQRMKMPPRYTRKYMGLHSVLVESSLDFRAISTDRSTEGTTEASGRLRRAGHRVLKRRKTVRSPEEKSTMRI